jgi:hypothetical protein
VVGKATLPTRQSKGYPNFHWLPCGLAGGGGAGIDKRRYLERWHACREWAVATFRLKELGRP